MKLYKFRPLGNCPDFCRIKDIIENGFYCCDFLNFNDVNEGVFYITSENKNISLNNKRKYKICSFSGKNALNSQLMWGHYANAGMGVAIELEVKNCKDIEEIYYNNTTSNSDNIKEILTRKSKQWEYEYEFRYIKEHKNINEEKENRNKKIYKNCIKKIYFGTPYKALKNYCDIKEKHTKLKKYLKLKEELEIYIGGLRRRRCICCKDYDFDKIT